MDSGINPSDHDSKQKLVDVVGKVNNIKEKKWIPE
jgi:hypothetical protein